MWQPQTRRNYINNDSMRRHNRMKNRNKKHLNNLVSHPLHPSCVNHHHHQHHPLSLSHMSIICLTCLLYYIDPSDVMWTPSSSPTCHVIMIHVIWIVHQQVVVVHVLINDHMIPSHNRLYNQRYTTRPNTEICTHAHVVLLMLSCLYFYRCTLHVSLCCVLLLLLWWD